MKISKFVGLVMALMLAMPAFGQVFSVRVDASINNIPTSYSGTNGQVLTGMTQIVSVLIDNRSGSEVAMNCTGGTSLPVPADSSIHNVYANTLETWAIDNSNGGNICYLRSMSGTAITTGIVVITATGY